MEFGTFFVLIYGVITGTAIFVLVYMLLFEMDETPKRPQRPRVNKQNTPPQITNTPPKLKPRKM